MFSATKPGLAILVGAVIAGCAISSSETVLDPVTIDWSDEGQLAAYESWTAYGCEGALVASICLEQNDKPVARLVIGSTRLDPASGDANLEQLAGERANDLAARFDCGELDISKGERESVVVAGFDGLRTTHRLSDPESGENIELLQYLTVAGTELMTLTTATPGPQGCISPDEMWIEPNLLEPLLPFFDGIAAGLPLSDSPQPAEPAEEGAPPIGETAEAGKSGRGPMRDLVQ